MAPDGFERGGYLIGKTSQKAVSRSRPRFDPVDILHAAYQLDLDADAWVKSVSAALFPHFDQGAPTVSHLTRVEAPATENHPGEGAPGLDERTLAHLASDEAVERIFYAARQLHDNESTQRLVALLAGEGILSHSEFSRKFALWRGLVPRAAREVGLSLDDALNFFATSGRGTIFMLHASCDETR